MATFKDTLLLVDKVSKPLLKISQGFKKLDERIGKSEARLQKWQKRTENIAKLGNKITNVGKGLTVGVTLPVLAMGGAMVKASADMEAMQQQLSTMLGSEDAGAKMFKEITNMASKTPFGTKELMQATNTMLGFGISQKKVLPLMNQLGDISGGNAERFQSLALAFSQVSSAGKLQGQDLMQMINAGFNPLESIAKRTGKSVGYWKEQMSKGKVTVEMVEQAMKDATSEGGRFFKMMEKQSKTALGQWSTFQDELNMLLADFGKIILPYAIKGLQKLSETLQWFNSLSPATKKTILVFGGIVALIGPIVTGVGMLITSIKALNIALMFLAGHPVVAVIMAIAGALIFCYAKFEGFRKIVQAVVDIIKLFFNVMTATSKRFWGWAIPIIKIGYAFLGWISPIKIVVGWLKFVLGLLGKLISGFNEVIQKAGGFRGIGQTVSDWANNNSNKVKNWGNSTNNSVNNSNNTSVVNNIKQFFAGATATNAQLAIST